MAPFDNTPTGNLTAKVSSLIDSQLPDFIRDDHPVFSKFLKHYYQFLEAGELQVTVTIDNLLLELQTASNVLAQDGGKVVLEDGSGTTGKFTEGETITGTTSGATATVLVDDLAHATKPRLFISSQQQFITGETITGGSSGATGTVKRYRGNPIQNIQQLLSYADVDHTIYDFLDQFRDSFMNAIPTKLASGLDKRKLVKNIRELYRAKGTSEGHKIFMRMLLDENVTVFYPNQHMLRVSDGKWTYRTIIRCTAGVNSLGSEVIGQTLTGRTLSGTVVIANALSFSEGGSSIIEFEINPDSVTGSFQNGEILEGVSTVQDVTMTFTIQNIVTTISLLDPKTEYTSGDIANRGGILYDAGDIIELDTTSTVGNGEASAEVETIKTGTVSDVVIDDAGSSYRVGDQLIFTATDNTISTDNARGFISIVDGSIALDGTDSSSTDAGDYLISESGTNTHIEYSNLMLEKNSNLSSLSIDTISGTFAEGETITGSFIKSIDTSDVGEVAFSATITDISGTFSDGEIITGEKVANANVNAVLDGTYTGIAVLSGATGTISGRTSASPIIYLKTSTNNFGTLIRDPSYQEIVRGKTSGALGVIDSISGSAIGIVRATTGSSPLTFTLKGDLIFGDALSNSNLTEKITGGTSGATANVTNVVRGEYGEPHAVYGTDLNYSTTKGYYYPLYLDPTRASNENAAGTGSHSHKFIEYPGIVFWMPTNDSNHAQSTYSTAKYYLYNDDKIVQESGEGSGGGSGVGDIILLEEENISLDSYGTGSDRFVVESGTSDTGSISRIFLENGGAGYTLLPTITVSTKDGTSAKLLSKTKTIGAIDKVKIINQGFNYNFAPEVTFRANFLLKDVSGTFETKNSLTTHTGTVRGYNATTQVLEVSFEDSVRVTLETSDSEGIRLESGTTGFSTGDEFDAFTLDSHMVPNENIVDANGNRIVLDADDAPFLSFIVLDGTDAAGSDAGNAILTEGTKLQDYPFFALETGSAAAINDLVAGFFNFVMEDDGTSKIKMERGVLVDVIPTGQKQIDRFIAEDSNSDFKSGVDDFLVTENSLDTSAGHILLDGPTADAGNKLLNENGGNNIVLNGIDSDASDANGKVLFAIEAADGVVALNGTDSSSSNANSSIINEAGIDFSAGTTAITDSGGATGTIVNADIAKATSTIGLIAETPSSYGVSVESQISEDLIRIQDSVYYQQFSYEIQAGAGTKDYMNQLKKAIHPAGFNAFGKASIATSISAAIGTTGSSLGGGYTSDTDTFSPILASTFEVIFDEVRQSRFYAIDSAVGNSDDTIILEEAEDVRILGDSIILDGTDSDSTDAGYSLLAETPVYRFKEKDFEAIRLEDETHGSGEFARLIDETDGERIISESAETISNNLVLDSTPDSGHITPTDSGSDILLDGTDSSSTDAGSSIELETSICDGDFTRFSLEDNNSPATLLNEDGGSQKLETAVKGGSSVGDRSVVSYVTTKVEVPSPALSNLVTGSITLARNLFTNRASSISLETATETTGRLALDGFNLVNTLASVDTVVSTDGTSGILLEDASDLSRDSGFTFESFGGYSEDFIVLNGTDGSSSNAGDNLILDASHADGSDASSSLMAEPVFTGDGVRLEDIVRPSILDTNGTPNSTTTIGILLEEYAQGPLRQEDGTTSTTNFGDDILLEDGTPAFPRKVGDVNRLLLEDSRIELEESINDGTIPSNNYAASVLAPFTRPAVVMSSTIGFLSLESKGNILLNRTASDGTDAGDDIQLEYQTLFNIASNA